MLNCRHPVKAIRRNTATWVSARNVRNHMWFNYACSVDIKISSTESWMQGDKRADGTHGSQYITEADIGTINPIICRVVTGHKCSIVVDRDEFNQQHALRGWCCKFISIRSRWCVWYIVHSGLMEIDTTRWYQSSVIDDTLLKIKLHYLTYGCQLGCDLRMTHVEYFNKVSHNVTIPICAKITVAWIYLYNYFRNRHSYPNNYAHEFVIHCVLLYSLFCAGELCIYLYDYYSEKIGKLCDCLKRIWVNTSH